MSSKTTKKASEPSETDFQQTSTTIRHCPQTCSRLDSEGNISGGQPQHKSESGSEMMEKEAVHLFQTTTTVHPLYNHVILQSVFEMLGVMDLKSCRQVCKQWDDLATPHMLSKGVVSINAEDTESLQELKEWINSAPWELGFFGETKTKLFTNFMCDKITHDSYPNLADILGPHTKLFAVSHWWGDSRDLLLADYEHLLLHQCTNLEELSIPSTKNFKVAKDFLLCAIAKNNKISLRLKTLILSGETKPSPKFWRIINISPALHTLKIYCQLNQEFWNPFPPRKVWDERMCNIQNLDVRSFGNESITNDSGDYFMTRKWTLKNITCEMYIVADNILRVCYDNIADTLESLNITFFNKHYDDWSVDKVHEGFLSPRLTKFKHWTLGLDDHCRGPVYCRNLLTAISLPNLISFKMIPYEDECNDSWPDGLFGQMLNDTFDGTNKIIPFRPSLKILTLPPKFQDISCIDRLPEISPNIKELGLHTPTVEVVSQILLKWTQLERLKMILSDDLGICWTSVLSGAQTSVGPEKATLSNLKKLASIEIVLTSRGSKGEGKATRRKCVLNDNLIYSSLIELPTIQNIVVKGHTFSSSAMDALRKGVPMFCHIDI